MFILYTHHAEPSRYGKGWTIKAHNRAQFNTMSELMRIFRGVDPYWTTVKILWGDTVLYKRTTH